MIRSPPWPVNIIVETGLPLPATVDAYTCIVYGTKLSAC